MLTEVQISGKIGATLSTKPTGTTKVVEEQIVDFEVGVGGSITLSRDLTDEELGLGGLFLLAGDFIEGMPGEEVLGVGGTDH